MIIAATWASFAKDSSEGLAGREEGVMPYQAVIPVLQQPNRLLTYNQTVSPPRLLR